MTFHKLFHYILAPEREPVEDYTPENSVSLWSAATEYPIVFEVHEAHPSLYDFRFKAWVNWRSLGGNHQGHDWYTFEPDILLTDDPNEALMCAKNYANSRGVLLSDTWSINGSFKGLD